MKRKDVILTVVLVLIAVSPILAQEQDLGTALNGWTRTAKSILQAIIGLASVGGGGYAYMKVNTDDGGNGKKAIGNFFLALVFGAIVIALIEFMLGTDVTIVRPS